VPYEEGMTVVFVSHAWMRPNVDAALAHPDDEAGTKFEVLSNALMQVAADRDEDLFIWLDFACIDQDDKEKKMKGVMSLPAYVSKASLLIVPLQEPLTVWETNVLDAPYYGTRAWCRVEQYIFSVTQRAQGVAKPQVFCYAPNDDGEIEGAPKGYTFTEEFMPSKGELTVEADRKAIKELETTMTQLLQEISLSAGGAGVAGALSNHMLTDDHVDDFINNWTPAMKSVDLSGNSFSISRWIVGRAKPMSVCAQKEQAPLSPTKQGQTCVDIDHSHHSPQRRRRGRMLAFFPQVHGGASS